MVSYVVRRLLLLVPMAAGMVVVTFGLLLLIPGDPASVLLGQEASAEAVDEPAQHARPQRSVVRPARLLRLGTAPRRHGTVHLPERARLGDHPGPPRRDRRACHRGARPGMPRRHHPRRRRRDAARVPLRYGGHAARPARRLHAGLLAGPASHAPLRRDPGLAPGHRARDLPCRRLSQPRSRAGSNRSATRWPTSFCPPLPWRPTPRRSSRASCAPPCWRSCARISCAPPTPRACDGRG